MCCVEPKESLAVCGTGKYVVLPVLNEGGGEGEGGRGRGRSKRLKERVVSKRG